jgi:hypothetical protein
MKYDPFKVLIVPRPIARLGYMDYGVINPENVFAINRPEVGADGKVTNARPNGPWDGQYR